MPISPKFLAFGKIITTALLDKDENLLYYLKVNIIRVSHYLFSLLEAIFGVIRSHSPVMVHACSDHDALRSAGINSAVSFKSWPFQGSVLRELFRLLLPSHFP